jgi:2-methylaconitate cis-trans-isomerase PrpF
MGLPDGDQSVPKVGVVGPGDASAEVNVRMISMSAPHPAIGLTSAVAIAAAATLPGSLVHDVAPAAPDYRIGTLSGAIAVQISQGGATRTVAFRRSARRIADALVYIPPLAAPAGHLATNAAPERVSTSVA